MANSDVPAIREFGIITMNDGVQGVKQKASLSKRWQRRLDKTQHTLLQATKKNCQQWLLDDGKNMTTVRSYVRSRELDKKFKSEVSKVLHGGTSDSKPVKDMAKAIFDLNSTYLQRIKDKGFSWAENVTGNKYFPRQWSREAVDLDDSADRLHFEATWLERMTREKDGKFLEKSDIDEFLNDTTTDEYKAFMDELNQRKGATSGKPKNFKYRIRLADSHKLSDFFESNYEAVHMRYAGNMEGHLTLADEGLTKAQFSQKYVDAVAQVPNPTSLKGKNTLAALNYAHNLILGNSIAPQNALTGFFRGEHLPQRCPH